MDYGQQYIPHICIINIPDMYVPVVETRHGVSLPRVGFRTMDLYNVFISFTYIIV